MGTWSVPWEDEETLARFEARMGEPWMAEATKELEPDHGPLKVGDEQRPAPDGTMELWRRSGLLRRWKKVEPIGTKESWSAEAPDLYGLFGDDSLFDELYDRVQEEQGAFDVRPLVRARLMEILDDQEDEVLEMSSAAMVARLRAVAEQPPA